MANGRKHTRRRSARGPGAAPPRRKPGARTRPALYWGLTVGLASVLVYLNAPGHEFVLDDTRLVRDNLRIRSLADLPTLFASPYWDLEGPRALYRPLVLASYAVNYAVHGLSTQGYAAVNIALHAAVSLLLFALLRGIGASLFVAGVAGLAFAVHPVHTEAVTAISGRPELLAAVFFLFALHFHRLAPSAGRRAMAYRTGTMVSFAAALLSKESALTLLLVVPVMDALFPAMRSDGRPVGPRSRVLSDYVPLVGIAVAYLAVRGAVLGGIVIPGSAVAPLDNPLVPMTTTPLGDRVGATPAQAILTAFAVVAEYARLLVWSARLSADYSYNQIPLVTNLFDGRFMAGVAVVAACAAGILVLWRRSPVAAFGLAFLALTFSIVSNLVFTIGTICAERLVYLPSAGLLIAAAAGAGRLARAWPARPITYGVLAVLIALGAARTWTRNQDWRNERTLWAAAVAVAPGSARVQSEYGRVLAGLAEDAARAGRDGEAQRFYAAARQHYETALQIYPSYWQPMDGLAIVLSLQQRYDEALVLFEKAVRVYPRNFASLTNWGALLWERSLGTAARAAQLRAAGRVAEADELAREAEAGFRLAVEKVDQAIAIRPSYAHAHLIRALLLDDYLHDPGGAIAAFEEVLRLMPLHPQRQAIDDKLARLRALQASPVLERE